MSLIVNGFEVKTNEDGMFSLNDLHEASGKLVPHLPAKFIRQKSVKATAEFLMSRYGQLNSKESDISNGENSPFQAIKTVKGKYNGGTWVCKQLVYKYAMWISDEFEVNVIEAFDALVMGELATALKIANNSAIINKVGDEFDRLTKDDQAVGEKAMNDFCNASGIYNTYSCKAGEDLASCRGKKKKRSDAEKAITERSQLSLTI